MPARSTPGMARTRSSTWSKKASACGVTRFMSCGVLSKYFVPPSRMSAVSRRRVSNPGRVLCSRRKPRIMRPAPTSSTIDNATSATSKRAAPPAATAARASAALLEDVVQVHARGPQRGQQAEDQARGDGDREREGQHARVESDLAEELRETDGNDQREEPGAPKASTRPKAHPTRESKRFSVSS